MKHVIEKFRESRIASQATVSILALIAYFVSSVWLEASYARSLFPVPYFEGQTSFSSEKIRTWYAYMINHGTFDIYFLTQLIDFVFISAVIVMGFSNWTLVANLHPKNSFFQRTGYYAAFALPLAGLFDILENLVSFIMIADPSGFPDSVVMVYSSFAVIKFGWWVVALAALIVSLTALLGRYVIRTVGSFSVNR